ncbi:unnamed protein product, partial [Effrenium voratum]
MEADGCRGKRKDTGKADASRRKHDDTVKAAGSVDGSEELLEEDCELRGGWNGVQFGRLLRRLIQNKIKSHQNRKGLVTWPVRVSLKWARHRLEKLAKLEPGSLRKHKVRILSSVDRILDEEAGETTNPEQVETGAKDEDASLSSKEESADGQAREADSADELSEDARVPSRKDLHCRLKRVEKLLSHWRNPSGTNEPTTRCQGQGCTVGKEQAHLWYQRNGKPQGTLCASCKCKKQRK